MDPTAAHVAAFPRVCFLIPFEEDVVLVLGSDGIFDVLSDAEVGGRGKVSVVFAWAGLSGT